MELTIDQVLFLRDLKGAPSSILLALGLTGLSLRQKDLELVTGYSDKTISRGLALLELHRLVQHNGRQSGWSMPNKLQFRLFPAAQLGRESRRISDSVLLSSSSLDPVLLVDESEEEESYRPNPEKFRFPKEDPVAQLLLRAGIGRASPKMQELISLDLDEENVRSWVLYYEWWVRESEQRPGQPVDGRSRFSTGTLIQVLLDGDPAPPPRCEQCLDLLPCYCHLIRT